MLDIWISNLMNILTNIYLIVFVSIIIFVVVSVIRATRYINSGILDVDKLDGFQFEDYCKWLFESRGYNVHKTPDTGDYGADLVVWKRKHPKIIVQCKHHEHDMCNHEGVQQVVCAKKWYNAPIAIVITNTFFRPEAKNLAGVNGVILYDRTDILNMIKKIHSEERKQKWQFRLRRFLGKTLIKSKKQKVIIDTKNK